MKLVTATALQVESNRVPICFADVCQFHPGVPVFHDALKGWSCCPKRSTDFTEFLNIPVSFVKVFRRFLFVTLRSEALIKFHQVSFFIFALHSFTARIVCFVEVKNSES